MIYKYPKRKTDNLPPSFFTLISAIPLVVLLIIDACFIFANLLGLNLFTLSVVVLHFFFYKYLFHFYRHMPRTLRQGSAVEIEISDDCKTIEFRKANYSFSIPISKIKSVETQLGWCWIYFKTPILSSSPSFIVVYDTLENFQQFQEELARCRDQGRKNA